MAKKEGPAGESKKLSGRGAVGGPLGALRQLVGYLNRPPDSPGLREAWVEAAAILTDLLPGPGVDPAPGRTLLTGGGPMALKLGLKPGMDRARRASRFVGLAVKRFNRLAAAGEVALHFDARRARPGGLVTLVQRVTPLSPRGDMLIMLWQALSGREWDRLRRCDQCQTWFLDESDSQTRRFCQRKCSARWWTRGRRRAAKGTPAITRSSASSKRVRALLKRQGIKVKRRRKP